MTRRRVHGNVMPFDPKKYKAGKVQQFDDIARNILQYCGHLYDGISLLDTAVRDVACQGMAYLLHVAYDCQACSLGLEAEAFTAFVDGSTAEWFRTRGFAEWFCQGAANLFNTSRPRTLAEIQVTLKPMKTRRKA